MSSTARINGRVTAPPSSAIFAAAGPTDRADRVRPVDVGLPAHVYGDVVAHLERDERREDLVRDHPVDADELFVHRHGLVDDEPPTVEPTSAMCCGHSTTTASVFAEIPPAAALTRSPVEPGGLL